MCSSDLGISRGLNGAQDLIKVSGAVWQGNVGPYILGMSVFGGVRETINAAPVVGAWQQGKDFIITGAIVAPFRTRCTVSGTPGTWVNY